MLARIQLVSDRSVAIDGLGAAYFDTASPELWVRNHIVIPGPVPGLAAASVITAADEYQASLRHRRVVVVDDALGTSLHDDLLDAGWEAERLVALATFVQAPAPRPGTPVVVEAHSQHVLTALRREWFIEDDWGDPDSSTELAGAAEARPEPGVRMFVSPDVTAPDAFCLSIDHGAGLHEIAELFASKRVRGRRHGAAVILAAWAAASAGDALYVWTDAEGPARPFYESLGFRAAMASWFFMRKPR